MSKESRRLLNRADYLAVVAAKRAAANVVIGDRSEVTGKYESSEPDGSKVFGSKIDNSLPDGNAVRSLKGEAGDLYLQGRTATPKPKFGALEEAIAPKVSSPLEIAISPFSKDGDSLSAVDIDNGKGGKGETIAPPTHLGNTLGYLRGQIWDSPVEGSKATYAYAAMGGYEVNSDFDVEFNNKKRISSALKFWIKFELIPAFIFCDLASDPLRNDDNSEGCEFLLHDLFLINPVEAIAIIRIESTIASEFDPTTVGYLAYYISGTTSTRIATQPPTGSYYLPEPELLPEHQRFSQFLPTTFYLFYSAEEAAIYGQLGYIPYAGAFNLRTTPVYLNFTHGGSADLIAFPIPDGFTAPQKTSGFVTSDERFYDDSYLNIVSPTRFYTSLIKVEDLHLERFLEVNRYIYQIDYTTESVGQFKKFKAIAYNPSEFGLTSFDETFSIRLVTGKKLYVFSPKFLIYDA
jgi:hypothetical protein